MMAILLLSSVVVGVFVGRWSSLRLPDWSINVVLYVIVFLVGVDLSKKRFASMWSRRFCSALRQPCLEPTQGRWHCLSFLP